MQQRKASRVLSAFTVQTQGVQGTSDRHSRQEPDGERVSDPVKRMQQALVSVAMVAASQVAQSLSIDTILVRASVNVRELLQDIFLSVLRTVPKGTADKDGKGWERWSGVMAELGVSAWRGNVAAHRGHDVAGYWKEVVIYQAVAYFRVLKIIAPRQRELNARGQLIGPKPESITVVKSVRRVHAYFGVQMAHSKIYASVLKASTVTFIDNHGLSALMPKRKSPFTNDELTRKLTVYEGTQLHNMVVSADSLMWKSVRLLVHVLALSGFRLADGQRCNDL